MVNNRIVLANTFYSPLIIDDYDPNEKTVESKTIAQALIQQSNKKLEELLNQNEQIIVKNKLAELIVEKEKVLNGDLLKNVERLSPRLNDFKKTSQKLFDEIASRLIFIIEYSFTTYSNGCKTISYEKSVENYILANHINLAVETYIKIANLRNQALKKEKNSKIFEQDLQQAGCIGCKEKIEEDKKNNTDVIDSEIISNKLGYGLQFHFNEAQKKYEALPPLQVVENQEKEMWMNSQNQN